TIHSPESDCIGAFLVKEGEIRVYMLSEDGREITLYRLGKGEVCMLSASCVLKNITFDVHISVVRDSEIYHISTSTYQKLIDSNIYVENFSYKIAMDRFSDVMWAMEQILFMSFDKRLAIFLIEESRKNNSETINLTHEQIAKYMGSAREVVSRMLKHFSNEGLVELSRGGVKILDKNRLKALTA
ncbi:MAG: Crp/Fnr family transcriptional regulator, partial [Oscillospiraceae bacterium]|nr:Crp/Fnr family transcriptional regulator [Oscillospiraceae bacterium]